MYLLAYFTFPCGFVVDYMHAVCSGYVRATACMWFTHKGPKRYQICSHVSQIDSRLQAIQPTWEISLLPRIVVSWRYWKASEWRSWLLYYSPVVLKGILPTVYMRNWMKFVHIMHILLGKSVALDQLAIVKKGLLSFLTVYQELYGKKHMTYNAHLLIHLVDSVREWGPLWCYSSFPFESMNGTLLKLLNGTRYVQIQVVEKYFLCKALPRLASSCSSTTSSFVKSFIKDTLHGYNLLKNVTECDSVVLYGKGEVDSGWRQIFQEDFSSRFYILL